MGICIASSYNCFCHRLNILGVTAFTGSVNGPSFNRVILELMVKLFNALQVIFIGLGGGREISPQC